MDATQLQRPGPPATTTVHAVQHRERTTQCYSCYRCGVIIHKSHTDSRWPSVITARRQAILRQSGAAIPKLLTQGRTTLLRHNQAVQILNRANVGPQTIKRSIKRALLSCLPHSHTAPSKPVHHTVDNEDPPSQSKLRSPPMQLDDAYSLFKVGSDYKPIIITLCVNKVDLPMELDTGASLSPGITHFMMKAMRQD
uniref:Uncharacterized protein n=1 Tax=Amphimedon queenslandica TaxID=400682 RepID=A0A1X7VMF5_AMPQE